MAGCTEEKIHAARIHFSSSASSRREVKKNTSLVAGFFLKFQAA